MKALFAMGRGPGGPPHLRLFGIPVRVELSFLLMGVILGSDGPPAHLVLWMAVLFPSVLFHELGHALVYRALGARSQIILAGMGGLTFGARDKPFVTWERVLVSLAGPFFGLSLGLGALALHLLHGPFESPNLETLVVMAAELNLFWTILNLLPIVPLDGGHVMEAILSRNNPLRGRIWARYISIVACALIGFAAYEYLHNTLIMFVMVLYGFQAFQGLMLLKQAAAQPVMRAVPQEHSEATEKLDRLRTLMKEERSGEARAVAFQLLSEARLAPTRDAALSALAWLAIGDGEPQQALQHLGRTSRQFDDPFLWGTAIAANGDAAQALPHLTRAFDLRPEPQVIMAYARVLEALGRRDDAVALAGEDAAPQLQRALAEALFRSRDFEYAARVSERLFARHGGAEDAYNAACARARQGEIDVALGLLQRATTAGFRDTDHLATDPDLAAVRERPEFRELLAQITPPLTPAR